MQDSIIGYLLDALDDDELARFEARLEQDPELRQQVRQAARSLRILQQDSDDDLEPPPGLAEATCALVHAGNPSLRGRYESSASSDRWSLADVLVACAVVLMACLLFFPAINNSRYHAQVASCQNNLRAIGRALIEYSGTNAQGFFPQVPETGNLAVAGMYAPTLIYNGLITEDRRFFCPASGGPEEPTARSIPKLEEIQRARGPMLKVAQWTMGGDYGYTLGVKKHGQLQGIRNRSRIHFAIMSDSPSIFDCESPNASRRLHRNVLFESGGVRVVRMDTDCWCGDQLYRNDLGQISAGLHDADAVIGSSSTAPVARVPLER